MSQAMLPAWFARLLTYHQKGQPQEYAGSDMMRADLEMFFRHPEKLPNTQWRSRLQAMVYNQIGQCANLDELRADLASFMDWLDANF